MPDLLDGRTAVVTGAASGNGRAIATRLAEYGADVVVADVRRDPREGGVPTHEHINETTAAAAVFVECDVTDWDDTCDAIGRTDRFGGLDIMVNNAGVLESGPITGLSEEQFDRVMDINVKGTFFGSKAAAAALKDGDGGSIINISSMAGIVGGSDNSIYCASKGAIRLLTYSLAAELGPHGIRVNAIHPGPVDTKMIADDIDIIGSDRADEYRQSIPLQRFGTPEDVGNAAVYLASDLSEFVTGSSLVVDGGISNTGGVN
ncbi:SDR family oxidoreductase [Haloarchaeobius iranensis]|uniref:NAD(P)-dependent dehydrogenase, short-chain alcohol dehydrogenase family n=1 Tax=Haloarchaeobius iranensis TaxID=996166 RepID=A0A1G9Z9S1_9EURY|nr:SDR family oxidoreductase [Haloarchaeobius iranensis]SDN18110.1 NAD(P)-dependent dehydrogenase, short-chain alcohol dehydrogenase family [Haloarchaeobius iranensis]